MSWNGVPRRNLPVEEAIKLISEEAGRLSHTSHLRVRADIAIQASAPIGTVIDWSLVIFVFGHVPELWGLGAPKSSKPSSVPIPASTTMAFEANADSMVVDNDAVDSSHTHPALCIGVTSPAIGSNEASKRDSQPVYDTIFSLFPIAMAGAQTTDSSARISAGVNPAPSQSSVALDPSNPSVYDDLVDAFLQDPDLAALLSAVDDPIPPPDRELSKLLFAVLHSKQKENAPNTPALKEATARKLRCLNQLIQVHEEFVKKLWDIVRHIRQWHTWGLEVLFFFKKHGVELPPSFRTEQHRLSTFVNGFTVLVYHLVDQQEGFRPPEL